MSSYTSVLSQHQNNYRYHTVN